jgi:hypothetical protein
MLFNTKSNAAEPTRKPMTEEEIKAPCDESNMGTASRTIFRLGIRFAEKHHGIGGCDVEVEKANTNAAYQAPNTTGASSEPLIVRLKYRHHRIGGDGGE